MLESSIPQRVSRLSTLSFRIHNFWRSCLTASGLVFLSFTFSSAQSPTPSPLPQQAYEIIGAVLKRDARKMELRWISVVRLTHRPGRMDCLEEQDTSAQWKSAVRDREVQNTAIFVIEPKFQLPFRYELADEMKPVGYLIDPPPGISRDEWAIETREEFRKRREEGYTQLEFSAPGMSADGTIAIVYSTVSYAGIYNVLYKRDNVWIVDIEPVCGWIS